MKDNSISCKHLSMQSCVRFFFALIVILFFTQCTEEKPTEQTEVKSKISLSKTGNAAKINFSATSDSTKKDSTKTKDKDKDKDNDKDIITPDALEYGWKREYQYVFDHYVAKREFGIMPTNYRQLAGSSGDPNRIQKLNELKSKWGFNYIAACIGDYGNIQAIVNAGFPISTNYMAAGFGTGGDGDRATVQNLYNGLSPETYFWAYYFDESYSHTDFAHLTQSSFKSFRDFVKSLRPNSLFGFGETTVYTANRYTHNPYYWYGTYYINYHPTQVDFVMCTKYSDYYNENDQRDLWDDLQAKYNNLFSRTWIAAHLDGGEFRALLGYCRDHGYAPWFYQMQDGTDNDDYMISRYCEAAWLEGFLTRYDKQYEVWFMCVLNHTHDPNAPWECSWVEDHRVYQGIIQR